MTIFTDPEIDRRHFFQSCYLPPEPTAEQIRIRAEQFRTWEKILAPLPDKMFQELFNTSTQRDVLVKTTRNLGIHTRWQVYSLRDLKIDFGMFCRNVYRFACTVIAGDNLSEIRERNNLLITLLEEKMAFLRNQHSHFTVLKVQASMFASGLEAILKEPPFSSTGNP